MVIHKGCLVGDYPALKGNWKFEVAFRMVLFLSNYSLFEFVFFKLLKKELMIEYKYEFQFKLILPRVEQNIE